MDPTSNDRWTEARIPCSDHEKNASAGANAQSHTGRRRLLRALSARVMFAWLVGALAAATGGVVLIDPVAAHAAASEPGQGLAASDMGAWVVPAKSADAETIFLSLRPAHVTSSGRMSDRSVVDIFQVFPQSRYRANAFAQLTGRVAFNSSGVAAFPFHDRQNGEGVCSVALGANHVSVTISRTRQGLRGPSLFQGNESFRRSNSGQAFVGAHLRLGRFESVNGPLSPASLYAGDWVWQSEQYRPRILGGLDMTLTFSKRNTAHLSLWQTSPFANQIAHIGTDLTFSAAGTAHFTYNDIAWGDRGVGLVRLDGARIILTLTRTYGGRAPYGIFPGRYVFV